jgi:hypothetical protein
MGLSFANSSCTWGYNSPTQSVHGGCPSPTQLAHRGCHSPIHPVHRVLSFTNSTWTMSLWFSDSACMQGLPSPTKIYPSITNSICRYALSKACHSPTQPLHRDVIYQLNLCTGMLFTNSTCAQRCYLPTQPLHEACIHQLHSYTRAVIHPLYLHIHKGCYSQAASINR